MTVIAISWTWPYLHDAGLEHHLINKVQQLGWQIHISHQLHPSLGITDSNNNNKKK